MLQELLLSLSGHPSPLLDLTATENHDRYRIQELLSPPERALLKTLSEDLGERHRCIRESATKISSSHPSIVCRAVAASIIATNLASFQRKIIEVERSILHEDPSLVGAYKVVPLSAIVSAFDGWGRKLQWLLDLVRFMEKPCKGDPDPSTGPSCSAAMVIKRLRDAMRTGYPDIAAMFKDLVVTAESAWLKQLSGWVLYGRHPGGSDFLIASAVDENSEDVTPYDAYHLETSLVPCFVTPSTAKSIFFIGKSLNHIRDRQSSTVNSLHRETVSDFSLLPNHLSFLSALQPPISTARFSEAVSAIRLSLSQNALQKLLPLSKVLETLQILVDFFLLERGEFAIALITSADERLSSRHQRLPKENMNVSSLNDLASLTIREGEVQGVLARAWTALALQVADDDDADEELDQAREIITLSIKNFNAELKQGITSERNQPSVGLFDDLLLGASTVMSLRIASPLDLFLTTPNLEAYSHIHAYLLAIRRAHLHLSKLFQLSALRRSRLIPGSKAKSGNELDSDNPDFQQRQSTQKARLMRPLWATISSAAFFLAELGGYFQGEVIQGSWAVYRDWLLPDISPKEIVHGSVVLSSSFLTGSSHVSSRPSSSRKSDEVATYGIHDPETLAQAHQSYLASIHHYILLDDTEFTSLLRHQMTAVDHLSALMQRLDFTVHNLISTSNDSTASHFALEERRLMTELQSSRLQIAESVRSMISRLREIDVARAREKDRYSSHVRTESGFVPWSVSGLDQLLLKFDYGDIEKLVPSQFRHS